MGTIGNWELSSYTYFSKNKPLRSSIGLLVFRFILWTIAGLPCFAVQLLYSVLHLLSRVSILTRDIDIVILSVRPSVCLSVRDVPV